MEKFVDYIPTAEEALPGTKENSDIRGIYKALASGRSLTALDAVFSNHTVCLGKYISILRTKYNIPIKDEWASASAMSENIFAKSAEHSA